MGWRLALGLACSLNQIPRTLDVARCGLRLTDTQAQREFSVQQGVSEIDVAGSIVRIAQEIAEVCSSCSALLVAWGGIEPPTQGFSVLCSTN